MKTLGIITINYNNAEGLRDTLKSVAAQSFAGYEFIVVDGGSTDKSLEHIKDAPNIAHWVSEKDGGIYEAQNKGIAMSSAEYLLFLNSGDVLADTDVLKNVLPYLDGKEDIIYGNMKIAESSGIRDGYMPDAIDLAQMMRDTLWHPVSFIHRRLFEKYGTYDTSYKIVADYEFFFRVIIIEKARTRHIPYFISVFRHDGASADPANVAVIQAEKEKVQEKYLSQAEIKSFHEAEDKRYREQQKQSRWFRRWFR